MYQMIKAYEESRRLLERRVHQITAALRDPSLQRMERERLELRRDILTAERIELLHAIRELNEHLDRTEDADGNYAGSTEQGRMAGGNHGDSGKQPGAACRCSAGAA